MPPFPTSVIPTRNDLRKPSMNRAAKGFLTFAQLFEEGPILFSTSGGWILRAVQPPALTGALRVTATAQPAAMLGTYHAVPGWVKPSSQKCCGVKMGEVGKA